MKKTKINVIFNNQAYTLKNHVSACLVGTVMTFASLFTAMPAYAVSAVADPGTSFPGIGYGAQVLDIVLKNWENPDPSATGTTSITVRIAKDGRPFSCETRAFSSSKITDASFCDTIAKIGVFPSYVGTQNPEITLTFRHDGNAQSFNQSAQAPLLNQNQVGAGQSVAHSLTSQENSPIPYAQTQTNSIQSPDPYHTNQQTINSSQQIPQLAPETAPSPTQSQLQQNHNLAQQPLLSSDHVSILNSTSSNVSSETPLHMQNTTQAQNPANIAEQNLLTADAGQNLTTVSNENTYNKNHEPQREITREEALAPPSENLVLPEIAMEEYSQKIFIQARTKIRPPQNIEQGTYSTVARIDINGKGGLQHVGVQKSSGNAQFDNAVISVLKNDVTYPPTPNKDQQSIWLTFTIRK